MIEYNSFEKLHIFKRFIRVFQNDANCPTICLWALYRDFLFKMNDFFNMTQTVRSFICGRFIVNFSLKWIDFLKWRKPSHHPFMDASSRLLFRMNHFSTWRKPSETIYILNLLLNDWMIERWLRGTWKMPSSVFNIWIFAFLSNLMIPWETKIWVSINSRKKL